jgi:hypothetical protein
MPLYTPPRAPNTHAMTSHINLRQGIAAVQAATNSGSPTAAAWPSANLAIYIPMAIDRPEVITALWVYNGSVNGNIDIGVYDEDYNRLVSTGAVAQSGANTIQSVDITDYAIAPGLYYMGLSLSSGTGQVFRSAAVSLPYVRAFGVTQEASAHPLPATATFAALANHYVPVFGMAFRSPV